MTTSRTSPTRTSNPRGADPHALSPILRRHLSAVAPPTPAEEKVMAGAIVDARIAAWAAALSDPARSPEALRVAIDAAAGADKVAALTGALPFQQWEHACDRAARSRPANVARSYAPGMAAMLAPRLADRSFDPADEALAAVADELAERRSPASARVRRLILALTARVRELAARELRLVANMAHKAHWGRQGDEAANAMTVEEFIAHGAIGLERGIRGFDPALGYRLTTYVTQWIRQAMTRAVEDYGRLIRLPSHLGETTRKVFRVARQYTSSLGREPTPEEIAAVIGKPVASVAQILSGAVPRVGASLDTYRGSFGGPLGGGGAGVNDDGDDPVSRLASGWMTPEEAMMAADEADENERRVGHLLTALPANNRERDVIVRKYGLTDPGAEEVSLKSIGESLGITRERVRQIHDKATQRMRDGSTMMGVV